MNPIAVAEIVIVSLYLMLPIDAGGEPVPRRLRVEVRQLRADRHPRRAAPAHDLVARRRRRSGSPGRSTPSTRPSSRRSTTERLPTPDDRPRTASPVLAGRSWRVADLPGGLTNHNLRVTTTTTGPRRRRAVLAERRRPARHRPRRRARQHPRGRGRPGSVREVVDYRPDLGMLVIGFLPGQALDDDDFADAGRDVARAADACRRLHAGPRFVGDFDMFARQAGYLATVRERGFRAAGGVRRPRRRLGPTYGGRSPSAPRPTVPCNNDLLAAQLHRRRRAGLADRLRVLRQQRRLLRARQHRHRVRLHARADRGLDRGLLRRARRRADLARVRLQALCSEYGWSLWGFIQAATSPIDFDFHGWGMERFEKAERDASAAPASTALLDEDGSPRG